MKDYSSLYVVAAVLISIVVVTIWVRVIGEKEKEPPTWPET